MDIEHTWEDRALYDFRLQRALKRHIILCLWESGVNSAQMLADFAHLGRGEDPYSYLMEGPWEIFSAGEAWRYAPSAQ